MGQSGTGTFTQSGGSNTASGFLFLGLGGSGTYNLSGTGQLSAAVEDVGEMAAGNFSQTGGSNTVTNSGSLYVGRYSGGRGTYSQSGGTNTVSGTGCLYLGYGTGASGTYSLSGGTLIASRILGGSARVPSTSTAACSRPAAGPTATS